MTKALLTQALKPVAVVTVEQLSGMTESLEGLDKNQPGYHWRKGWNDALRKAMDYAAPPKQPASQTKGTA
jgi:hypothetical protein